MSGYHCFASFYDILTENISYRERAEYFDALVKKHGGRKNILLDLACGTGSLSEAFSAMGYDVIGVDSSEEMLNAALDKKFESGHNIQYLCQDMTCV
ncbi:MAG: class I SAM-dependent methyltransferase, partial [Oscillospiraceae bacterium]|nr:class I SAM-dependent methyltransferase [Oscillospiraceae bacterium]